MTDPTQPSDPADRARPTDRWTDRLSEYLDGELPAAEREALERHLEACAGCRGTLADLREVVARARELEAETPPHDLWPEIAGRIAREAEEVAEARRRGRPRRGGPRTDRPPRERRVVLSLPQLAAAAIALMALAGGLVWAALAGGPGGAVGGAPGTAAGPGAPPEASLAGATSGAAAPGSTLARYQAAIAELERVVFEEGEALDTATIRRIRASLAAIDRAIEEARRALREDPADPYANRYVAETMHRKLELLQRTASLAVSR